MTTFYIAKSGTTQIPFTSKDAIVAYFDNSDASFFDAIMDDIEFFEVTVNQIESPLKEKQNGQLFR